MKILYLLLLLMMNCNNNFKIFYHSFQPTESIPKVICWNIDSVDRTEYYIKEEIDSLQRVVEISFHHNENIFDIWPMYGVPIVRYKYLENRIYEYYFDKDGYLLSGVDGETPFCRVYHLDENKEISKCEMFYYVGAEKLQSLDINNKSICKSETRNADYVIYYLYSYYKMNNVFPKAKGFLFDEEVLEQVYGSNILWEYQF